MKIKFPSGEIFEGTVEEFKVAHRKYYNKKLGDIIFENYSKKNIKDSLESTAVAIYKIRDGIITIAVANEQRLSINAAMEIDDAFFCLCFEDFNSDNKVEQCILSYNNISFGIVVDKHQTTKENVFITEIKLINNDIPTDISKILSLAESLAKPIISTTLKAINIFINGHSSELSLKNFGYTQFE